MSSVPSRPIPALFPWPLPRYLTAVALLICLGGGSGCGEGPGEADGDEAVGSALADPPGQPGESAEPGESRESSEPVGTSESALLGNVTYGTDCTPEWRQFLDRAMFFGRTAAVSTAYAQCVDKAFRTATSTLVGSAGPYLQCSGDPYLGSPISTQISKALDAARGPVDLHIDCTGGGGNASATVTSYGSLDESLAFSTYLTNNYQWYATKPVCTGSNGPNCRLPDPWPFPQFAGTIWHEGMHQQGYGHGANTQDAAKVACGYAGLGDALWHFQRNTQPYIMGSCMEEVLSRSANVCGNPDTCGGSGLRMLRDFDGASCECVSDPWRPTVTWTRMGRPFAASKIAACGDGRLYALNDDRTLWTSPTGADGTWRYVTQPGGAQSITCAGNQLHAFNDDRSFWRNIGSDTSVLWQWVGRPTGARQLVGATPFFFGPYATVHALNDDHTLWRSPTGADGTWRNVGWPNRADRIAAGGGALDSRVFALNDDRRLFLNSGDGCDSYWHYLDTVPDAREIAASTATTIYRLDADRSLWKGVVRGSDYLTSTAYGRARICNGSRLVPAQ